MEPHIIVKHQKPIRKRRRLRWGAQYFFVALAFFLISAAAYGVQVFHAIKAG